MVVCVELSSDTYLVCLRHALSTEKEEVMGLLMGEMVENKVVRICSAYAMRRSDKQPDRVEISPEQLSAAAIEAEHLANKLNRPIRVVGWYHSHPHITVWPSHVDVRTQADYQMMDPNFIGLIFSCFNEADKRQRVQLICFQSLTRNLDSSYEHFELPLKVTPTPLATVNEMCVSALIHLPDILLEEEKEAYTSSQRHQKDLLTMIHNSGVYTQSLTHILQIVAVPLIQMLEGEIERNKKTVKQLKSKKEKLLATLEELDSTSQIV